MQSHSCPLLVQKRRKRELELEVMNTCANANIINENAIRHIIRMCRRERISRPSDCNRNVIGCSPFDKKCITTGKDGEGEKHIRGSYMQRVSISNCDDSGNDGWRKC